MLSNGQDDEDSMQGYTMLSLRVLVHRVVSSHVFPLVHIGIRTEYTEQAHGTR